mmetsp:Transcript_78735/g.230994  ORF Transcript_78735/g.230994 Transcript_78735/m.230994 type:complete len:453 (-) Transcript_78735:217-1575(-)
MLSALRGQLATQELQEDAWHVGGRYRLRHGRCAQLRAGPELEAPILRMTFQPVLLLQTSSVVDPSSRPDEAGAELLVGLVASGWLRWSGWITLEDPSGPGPLVRQRLNSSWEAPARYLVQHLCTIRLSPELSSNRVCEVLPGEEVLSLRVCASGNDSSARLRMMVSTEANLIGWISPETVYGDKLLYPLNLLGPELARLRQRKGTGRAWMCLGSSVPASLRPRRSFHVDAELPWIVGGQYRVLENVGLMVMAELSSPEAFKIAAGTLVTVCDMHHVQRLDDTWCPVASVTVDEGPARGCQGWLPCTARKGHDRLDTRNQKEFAEILEKLGRQGTVAVITGHPVAGSGEEENTDGAAGVVNGMPRYSVGWPVFDSNGELQQAEPSTPGGTVGSGPVSPEQSRQAISPTAAQATLEPELPVPADLDRGRSEGDTGHVLAGLAGLISTERTIIEL